MARPRSFPTRLAPPESAVLAVFLPMVMAVLKGVLPEEESHQEDNIYGIRTNISAVNEYCNLLIKYIEKKPIKTFQEVAVHVTEGLLDFGFENTRFQEAQPVSVWKRRSSPRLVLNHDDYLSLESQILDNYKDMNIMDQLFEMQRVYHRCVFDCFNEVFTELLRGESDQRMSRNGTGRFGWVSKPFLQTLLQQVKNQVLDNTLMLCGLIKDKEDSMMGKSVKNFDTETIGVIREERLSKLARGDLAVKLQRDAQQPRDSLEGDRVLRDLCQSIEALIFRDCLDYLGIN
jgi:hypothetical protein